MPNIFSMIFPILKITLKFSKYVSELGIKKEEKEKLSEKAYEEFVKNYGERWNKIADDLFEKADSV